MSPLDQIINQHFAGQVVRKDLVKAVKGNAIVPTYVLEYLLGQYCTTSDEASVSSGIETVKQILAKHYVHRNEAGLIKSTIKEKGRHKVIDKISIELNENDDSYEASFSNLGIKKVLSDSATIKKYPRLLVSPVWCLADVEYAFSDDENKKSPWVLGSIKPIQLASFDFEKFLDSRRKMSTEEWIDTLIQSLGFNPEFFSRRSKLLQLVRMIPFVERNYNLIELGPKGTGKSHIYSEFSPHGMLISGGEVTVPKLFVNNTNGKIGLVGYWDCVAFDEFAGKGKSVDKALVDIMKNYMANKSFSRGKDTHGAEASMVFVGNTSQTVPHLLRHSHLFEDLPEKYQDSAFLDRLHFYIPGWEFDNIRPETLSSGYGFVVDYLAEVLRYLRNHDQSTAYEKYFRLPKEISIRDRDGIHKTFSGLMKIIFPHGEASEVEIEELLAFSIEGRKRVKDQLMLIDRTYKRVVFGYETLGGKKTLVSSLEEIEHPSLYAKFTEEPASAAASNDSSAIDKLMTTPVNATKVLANDSKSAPGPQPGHRTIRENQKGISYDSLFGEYLKGAKTITLTDPYIRIFYQLRNFMEFIECCLRCKAEEEDLAIHLVTVKDEFKDEQQLHSLMTMQQTCANNGITLTWDFDTTGTLHARHIITDTGWKISLDRGLDIFQHYDMNDSFSLSNRLQQYRGCKAFEVKYLRG